jgi:plastocyanin
MKNRFMFFVAVAAMAFSIPASAGTVNGTIKFEGTPPKQKPIDMAKEPVCQKEHNPPATTQVVVPGPNNTLENVVVYVSEGLPAGKTYPVPSEPVVYDQHGCMYSPHVVAIQVNQDFKVTNSDPVSHNIHPLAKINREWNKSQPPGSGPINEKFDKPEISIPVKCNIHPWMRGYIAVVDNPYHAVSGENGKFTIKDLPPGTYTLTAWQEGWGKQTQQVTITGNETKTVDFTYKAKPIY